MRATVPSADLERIARQHVHYEVERLVLGLETIQVPRLVFTDRAGRNIDANQLLAAYQLEGTLAHFRNICKFLLGTNAHPRDVIAADYFTGEWNAPTVVTGGTETEQVALLNQISRRLHHISLDRLADGSRWDSCAPQLTHVLWEFVRFVHELSSDGTGERAAWFADSAKLAKCFVGETRYGSQQR